MIRTYIPGTPVSVLPIKLHLHKSGLHVLPSLQASSGKLLYSAVAHARYRLL